jgi:hypothetical protein
MYVRPSHLDFRFPPALADTCPRFLSGHVSVVKGGNRKARWEGRTLTDKTRGVDFMKGNRGLSITSSSLFSLKSD